MLILLPFNPFIHVGPRVFIFLLFLNIILSKYNLDDWSTKNIGDAPLLFFIKESLRHNSDEFDNDMRELKL